MNTFASAIDNQEARTENGMKARKSTASPCVELFYKIGAMRNQNVIPAFTAAYVADKNVSLRIAQWARDIRGGAGERKIFRDILLHLEKNDSDAAKALMRKAPELGRWDDLLVFKSDALRRAAFEMISKALADGNGVCAKWMPDRKSTRLNSSHRT